MHLDLAFNGSDTTLQFNQSYAADAEVGKWLRNADFRRALSLGIDRDQLNETFWLGVGIRGSAVPADASPYNPGAAWRSKWSTHDPDKANAMLDAAGLTKKDSEGFRVRTDNGERLRIEVQAVKAFLPWPQQPEMIAQQWKKIGIDANVREFERGTGDGPHPQQRAPDHGLDQRRHRAAVPVPAAMPSRSNPTERLHGSRMFAKWFASNGEQGHRAG